MLYFCYKVRFKDIWLFDGAFVVSILFFLIQILCYFSGNKGFTGGSESLPRVFLTVNDIGCYDIRVNIVSTSQPTDM